MEYPVIDLQETGKRIRALRKERHLSVRTVCEFMGGITQRGIRRREFGRFISSVEEMPKAVTDFNEALWGGLVDHVTVHSKDNIVFTLTCGMEIKA